jgi:hypothetical protein
MLSSRLIISMSNTKLKPILYVKWEESERGWGVRPDGCSLHKSVEDYESFLKDYWDKLPSAAPDEYSRPASEPLTAYASKKICQEIKGNGIFVYQSRESDLRASKKLVVEARL